VTRTAAPAARSTISSADGGPNEIRVGASRRRRSRLSAIPRGRRAAPRPSRRGALRGGSGRRAARARGRRGSARPKRRERREDDSRHQWGPRVNGRLAIGRAPRRIN
jgi:hypothetical protein